MKPSPSQPPNQRSGVISVRLLAGIAVICLLPLLILADPPAWWASRGVTSGTTLSGTNDYAVANQGQLKNIATAAFNELQDHLPSGAGDQLTTLINSWATPGPNTNDYAAVNIGQVKNVATPLYDRLIAQGFASQYPWQASGNPTNDYAVANIGQVKNLFSFDLTTGTATNGVPDMWEMNWFGTTGSSGTSPAPCGVLDSNGTPLTIQECYLQGRSPIDYYNGVSPTLAIISGSGQTSASGTFLPAALVVRVTGTSNQPLVNAPVTFSVSQGTGVFASGSSGSSLTSNSMQVRTGTDGTATICFQQPFVASYTSNLMVFAEGSEVDFNETTSADNNPPSAPSNVTADVWPDGSVVVNWTDNSDNGTEFAIQHSPDGGQSWTTVGTVCSGTTWYVVPSSADVIPGDPIAVAAECSSGSTNSGTVPAILPVPKKHYAVIDISGTNTMTNSSTAPVLSMAMNDSGQVTYCFIRGTFYGGTDQVTVNTWNSGTTTSGTITCDGTSQVITSPQEDADEYNPPLPPFSGFRDESINTSVYYNSFYENDAYLLIETPYQLWNPSPPSVLVTQQGNAYGTVEEACYFAWYAGTEPNPYGWHPVVVDNAFYWTAGTQQKQVKEFTDPIFTTGTTNLIVNNDEAVSLQTDWAFTPYLGTSVLACSANGTYFSGIGSFRMPNPSLSGTNPEYYNDGDFFIASYISSSSGTTIFYDPNQGDNTSLASLLPGTVTATGTAFTPAAINDNGFAIGGQYYWNGSSLQSLSDSTAVGTALNDQNMAIGYDTASGTNVGMLWLLNSGSATPITMQSVVAVTPFQNEIQSVMPIAISGTNSSNMTSILCSGSVLEGSGTAAAWQSETLCIQVNSTTPSGTATPPTISILKIPSHTTFPAPQILADTTVWGVSTNSTRDHSGTPANTRILANANVSGVSTNSTPNPSDTPASSPQKAQVAPPAEFKLRDDSNVFQGWDSSGEPKGYSPSTIVGVSNTNSLVKLVLSDSAANMNLELVVDSDSQQYISLNGTSTSIPIKSKETNFDIKGLKATGNLDAQIYLRVAATQGGKPGHPLAALNVVVLPPKTIHVEVFYCSADKKDTKNPNPNPNTALPNNVPTAQAIVNELNATFNPQANVNFVLDNSFSLNDIPNVFAANGGLPYPDVNSPAFQQPYELLEKASFESERQKTTDYRIFVVNHINSDTAAGFTVAPEYNFSFLNANVPILGFAHEAGRALEIPVAGVMDEDGGPFDEGPWPLELKTDGLPDKNQEGLMNDKKREFKKDGYEYEIGRSQIKMQIYRRLSISRIIVVCIGITSLSAFAEGPESEFIVGDNDVIKVGPDGRDFNSLSPTDRNQVILDMRAMLDNTDFQNREEAFHALFIINDENTIKRVAAMYHGSNGTDSYQASRIIKSYGHEAMIPYLIPDVVSDHGKKFQGAWPLVDLSYTSTYIAIGIIADSSQFSAETKAWANGLRKYLIRYRRDAIAKVKQQVQDWWDHNKVAIVAKQYDKATWLSKERLKIE